MTLREKLEKLRDEHEELQGSNICAGCSGTAIYPCDARKLAEVALVLLDNITLRGLKADAEAEAERILEGR